MNTKTVLMTVVIIVIAIALVYLLPKQGNDHQSSQSNTQPISQTVEDKSTLAGQWQWGESDRAQVNNAKNSGSAAVSSSNELPFTPQSVFDALQAVKVDENGDLILDHNTLVALDEALERIYNRLDSESLLSLEQLIQDYLPGKVGNQTSELVSDYHDFLKAQESFNQMHSSAPGAQNIESLAAIEYDQQLYEQLKSLRARHLGDDVAAKLFQQSNINAEYMFENIKLRYDTDLQPEERAARRQELEQKRQQQMQEVNQPPS